MATKPKSQRLEASATVIRRLDEPLVSVIVPVYNRRDLIRETLESVSRQTIADRIELVVVDDGSTDGTAEAVESLSLQVGGFVTVRQPNRGPSAARNSGLAVARGRYTQFLDSDDLLQEAKLERQLRALDKHPRANVASCLWGEFEGSPQSALRIRGEAGARPESMAERFLGGAFWTQCVGLYQRGICDAAGPWPENLRVFEDWVWNLRVGLAGGVAVHVPELLALVRQHGAPRLSNTSGRPELVAHWNRYMDAVLEHVSDVRRAGGSLCDRLLRLLVTTAVWNFRIDEEAVGFRYAGKAFASCPVSAKWIAYRILFAGVGILGPRRAVALFDVVTRALRG